MNQSAKDYISQYASAELTPLEYKNQLTHMRNMDMLCHSSNVIDLSTIRYFSVNNLVLSEDGNYYILLISDAGLKNTEVWDSSELYNRTFTYTLIQEIVRKKFTGQCMFYSAEIDGHLVVILCFIHENSKQNATGFTKSLENDCRQIVSSCKEQFDIDARIYLSSMIHGIQPMAIEYHKLLNYDIYLHYLESEQVPATIVIPYALPSEPLAFLMLSYAKELTASILNFEDYKTCAMGIISKIIDEPITSIEELKTHFISFLTFLSKELSNAGIPIDLDYLQQQPTTLFAKSIVWHDITDWFFLFLQDTVSRYNNKCHSLGFQRISNIKAYVDEHFCDSDLSVTKISDIFCMNQAFLSTAFKKQYKLSISSYIQTMRLSLAENLLRTTNQTVNKIYQKTGFGSAETFYRAFRKEFGVSPSHMRHQA